MHTRAKRTQAHGLCAAALLLIGCGLIGNVAASRVAMYMTETKGVLDLNWDQGPSNLAAQLLRLGFTVEPSVAGQPNLSNQDAYVIPAQNGQVFYSEAEDMQALASYIASGGLVVMLDANTGHGDALKSFVSKALDLKGDWTVCKRFASNAHTNIGEPGLAKHAADFLAGEWPASLEDAQVTTVQSWCAHHDTEAIITPLYTVFRDELKTVAQAFTKTGSAGAVVWLGYSWKDGPQANWGKVLAKIVNEHQTGRVNGAATTTAQSGVEHVIEAVADAAAGAAVVSRRFLQGGYFPPPAPIININPSVFSPVPLISPRPVVPSPAPAPVPVSPTPSPVPAPEQPSVPFANVLPQGTLVNGTLIYKFDPNYAELRRARSALNLLRVPTLSCPPPNDSLDGCYNCPRAYQAYSGYRNPDYVTLSLFFYNAVQISRLTVTQIKAPGLLKVTLLKFNGVGQASADLDQVVFEQDKDSSACGDTTTIDILPSVSHINDAIPDNTPAALQASAFQGVALTFYQPPQRVNATIVTQVRFTGRALYASPSLFGARRKQ